MTIHDFSESLPQNIVQRGREYFENGKVQQYTVKENLSQSAYRSVIRGSDLYTAEVTIQQPAGDVIFYRCSCPIGGEVCKHIVALLFEISESEDQPRRETAKTAEGETIHQLTEKELKDYVTALISENSDVKKHFNATFAWKHATSKNDYKAIITKSMQSLRGAVSFRDPDAVYKAMEPVRILLKQAENSLHNSRYLQSFHITQAVLEKLVPSLLTIDDSNGWISAEINEAIHLQYLLTECVDDSALKKEMCKWFIKTAPKADFTTWDCAWDLAHMAAILSASSQGSVVEGLVTKMANSGNDSEWGREFSAQRATEVMLTFYHHHKSEKEVNEFIEDNLEYSSIRERAVRIALNNGNQQRAIELCMEGVELSTRKQHSGQVNAWYKLLVQIYQEQSNRDKLVECALYLFKNSHHELTYYKLLKEQCSPDQWKSIRSSLLETYRTYYKWYELATVHEEEGEHAELMNVLTEAAQFRLIRDFAQTLLPMYRLPLLELGFSIIENMLEMFADRAHYRKAADHLNEMKNLIGGAEIEDFKQTLIRNYPSRKALIDELSRV